MQRYTFAIDADDLIRTVSDSWVAFARQNGECGLETSDVIGRPLWEFVGGAETRQIYHALFAAVRRGRLPRSVPFRCDGPDCRRFMRLTVSPLADDALELVSELLREEPRAPVAMLGSEVERSAELLSMCSWCKRVRLPAGWVEVEIAVETLGLFGDAPMPRISHGMCGECRRAMSSLVEAPAGG